MPQTRHDTIRFPFGTTTAGREKTGDVYYVCNAVAGASDSAATHGSTPDAPFLTIDFAVGQCTADNADVIFVMPGHVENVAAAGGLDLDVSGINIVGMGEGQTRARINLTTLTTADIDIDAANITLENFVIDLTGIDAILAGIDVNAAYFTLKNCEVIFADSGGQATVVLATDTNADGLKIIHNDFLGSNNAGCASVFLLAGATVENVTIAHNFIRGRWTTACFDNQSGNSFTDMRIHDNVVRDFFGGVGFQLDTSSSTGVIYDNKFSTPEPSVIFPTVPPPVGIAYFNNEAFDSDAGDSSYPQIVPVIGNILLGGTSMVDLIIGNQMFHNRASMRTVTADFTSATWNTVASHEVFTVTGLVRVRIIVLCTGSLTSGGSATLVFGNESTSNAYIASTTATDIVANELWFDATPTEADNAYATVVFDRIVNGVDIGYTVGTAALTGGSLVFYCWYEKLNSTGAVASGAGGPL